jgi:hypothetical protein
MMAAKKSAPRRKQTSSKAQAKVHSVMREYKQGQLESGGKRKVKNRKQAVAIALNEALRSGARVAPKKKSSAKKSGSKKSAARKSQSKASASKR